MSPTEPKAANIFNLPLIVLFRITLNTKVLLAVPAIIGIIIVGSALVVFSSDRNGNVLGNNGLVIVRDTHLEEKIFDNVVHDHSLDSRRAVAFNNAIDSDTFDLQDRLILTSLKKHDLTLAKRLLFAKLLDEDEILLKKKLIFNAVHEFDHHNFHDFDHDLHLGSGVQFQDALDDLNNFQDLADKDGQQNCMNVWLKHNLLQRVCP